MLFHVLLDEIGRDVDRCYYFPVSHWSHRKSVIFDSQLTKKSIQLHPGVSVSIHWCSVFSWNMFVFKSFLTPHLLLLTSLSMSGILDTHKKKKIFSRMFLQRTQNFYSSHQCAVNTRARFWSICFAYYYGSAVSNFGRLMAWLCLRVHCWNRCDVLDPRRILIDQGEVLLFWNKEEGALMAKNQTCHSELQKI